MTDVAELERRITMALDRIAQGLEALAPAGIDDTGPSEAEDALRRELEEERAASVALAESTRELRQRQEKRVQRLEGQIERLTAQIETQAADVQRLQQVNSRLRDTISGLRAAVTENLADPALVNRALQAELEALQASRQAELTEMNEILAELEPLVEEQAHG